MTNIEKIKKRLYETRYSFGATAAIITNLSLIVGLRTGFHAKLSIIGSMLVIAVADNISDSVGIHIYQESECIEHREVWISTLTNFSTRFFVSLTFIFLVLLLPLDLAVVVSLIWGLSLLSLMSYLISRDRKINPALAILEHLSIATVVLLGSNFFGKIILTKFKL